jgi:phosphoribosyl-ATP pyrophosphohydrolase
MFHLLVLWADAGVRPREIWAELARREIAAGFDAKERRD